MTDLITHWISLGLGLCLLYVPPLWWRESRGSKLIALSLVALALVQLQLLLTTLELFQPLVFALHEIALYAVAPLLYLGISALRGEDTSTRRIVLHLAPTLVIIPVTITQILRDDWLNTLQQPVYVAAFAAGAVYVFGVLRRLTHFTHPVQLLRLEMALLVMVMVSGTGVALLALLGVLFAQPAFNLLYGSAITGLLVLFHFVRLAYPQLTEVLADELRDAAAEEEAQTGDAPGPARRSLLTGVDIPEKVAALHILMQAQHFHRREDADLATVAAEIGLSSHQLSELVNEHLGLNFSRWLKQYRIADARELLVAKPAMSVLDVGLVVGFSSMSAFYAAFREIEGMAPGVYRKQQLERKKSSSR